MKITRSQLRNLIKESINEMWQTPEVVARSEEGVARAEEEGKFQIIMNVYEPILEVATDVDAVYRPIQQFTRVSDLIDWMSVRGAEVIYRFADGSGGWRRDESIDRLRAWQKNAATLMG